MYPPQAGLKQNTPHELARYDVSPQNSLMGKGVLALRVSLHNLSRGRRWRVLLLLPLLCELLDMVREGQTRLPCQLKDTEECSEVAVSNVDLMSEVPTVPAC